MFVVCPSVFQGAMSEAVQSPSIFTSDRRIWIRGYRSSTGRESEDRMPKGSEEAQRLSERVLAAISVVPSR
jgi:hypothetical protein